MRLVAISFLRFAMMVAIALVMTLTPAHSRIVAILFDDSGSMGGKDALPSFGAQLLVSTLDGRQGKDRLFGAVMSELKSKNRNSVVELSLRTQQNLKDTISRIQKWRAQSGGTPFQQISMLLEKIQEIQKPDEEAFLIILTDGAFSPNDICTGAAHVDRFNLRGHYKAIKQNLVGPLRVEFMLMGPNTESNFEGQCGNMSVAEIAEWQEVRSSLLGIFNGDSNDGRTDVRSAPEMVEAFKSIIARITSTDRDGIQKYIKKKSDGLEITTPLAIRRIVSVSTTSKNGLFSKPQPEQKTINFTDRAEYFTNMQHKDRGAWADARLKAHTSHFIFQPPLPAGKHFIKYSKRPDDVFLLFQTAADLRQIVIDEQGKVVAPGPNGAVRLAKNSNYTLALEVHDTDGAGTRLVPVSAFGGDASFRAFRKIAGTQSDIDLKTADDKRSTQGQFPTKQVGLGTIDASMRIKGFVNAYAKQLKFEIIDTKTDFALSVKSKLACPGCAEGEIRVTLGPGQQRIEVADIVLAHSAQIAGEIALSIENAPPGLKIEHKDESSDKITRAVDGKGRQELKYRLLINSTAEKLLKNGGRMNYKLVANALEPLTGTIEKSGTLIFSAPKARMAYTGNSQDGGGASKLVLDIDKISAGGEGINFAVFDNITDLKPEEFTITSDSWLIDFKPVVDGNKLSIQPSIPFLCDCFLFWDQGNQNVQVEWLPAGKLQQASAKSDFNVSVPFQWQAAIACGILLAMLLGFIYLIIAIARWRQANTFPAGSGLDVTYGKRADPIFKGLAKNNWTPIKALFWPIFGIPHQKAVKEGLRFTAARGGVLVDLRKSNQITKFDSLGITIKEKLEFEPNSQTYKVTWGDRAAFSGSTMTFLRKAADRRKRSEY